MSEAHVSNVVLAALKDIGEGAENTALINADNMTPLFGRNLDSLGIVSLIAELEERIADAFSVNITLADERAMSQKTSPFRSVETLTKYVELLINEQKAGK